MYPYQGHSKCDIQAKEDAMSTHRMRKYPRPVITPAERAALEALQGGCCAICGRDDVELHVYHSYRTGRTRGLLCRTCKTGLGQLKDSAKRLRAALHYLLRPPALEAGSEESNGRRHIKKNAQRRWCATLGCLPH